MGGTQHFADDDGVIARIVGCRLPAFETGERARNDRNALVVDFPVKIVKCAAVAGEAGAQHVLICAQHMDGEMRCAAEGRIAR